MITKQQVEQFNNLNSEKVELEVELNRINDFSARKSDNKDSSRAINQGKILIKFAGTACMLPIGIFNAELTKRKKEIEDRLVEIEAALQTI